MESDFTESDSTKASGQHMFDAGEKVKGEESCVVQAFNNRRFHTDHVINQQSLLDTSSDNKQFTPEIMSSLTSGPIFNKIVHGKSGSNDSFDSKLDTNQIMSMNKNEGVKEHLSTVEEDEKFDIKPKLENDFDPERVKTEIESSDDDGSYDFSNELGVVKSEMFDDDSGNVAESSDGLEKLFAMQDITCEDCNKPIHTLIEYHEHLMLHADGSKFTCHPCNKVFDSKKKWKEHNRSHSDVQHSCHICEKSFTRKDSLENHVRIHNNLKEFKCDLCDKRFNVKKQMNRHRQSHFKKKPDETDEKEKSFIDQGSDSVFLVGKQLTDHKHSEHPDMKKSFTCHVCDAVFPDLRELRDHKRTEHPDIKKSFSCQVCHAVFNDGKRLASHKRSEHPDMKGQHNCPICNKAFYNGKNLRSHMKIHMSVPTIQNDSAGNVPNGPEIDSKSMFENQMLSAVGDSVLTNGRRKKNSQGGPLICDECGKVFALSRCLHKHIRNVHSKCSYPCPICGKVLKNKTGLTKHKNAVHSDVKYPCDVCGESFATRRYLRRHMIKHSDAREYQCEICDLKVKTLCSLKRHMIIHSDEKKYKCPTCHRAFKHAAVLLVHKRIHTGERLFHCSYCPKGFICKSHLLIHERRHIGGSFPCEICHKVFTTTDYRRKHMKLKHFTDVKNVFNCTLCGKHYAYKWLFDRHMKMTHSNASIDETSHVTHHESLSQRTGAVDPDLEISGDPESVLNGPGPSLAVEEQKVECHQREPKTFLNFEA